MGGLLSLSSIEAYCCQGREKALCLGFPFLGSCVWVLQCLKERQRVRDWEIGFCMAFCLGVEENKFYQAVLGRNS